MINPLPDKRLNMRLYAIDARLLRACLLRLRQVGPYGSATSAADVIRAGLQALACELKITVNLNTQEKNYAPTQP